MNKIARLLVFCVFIIIQSCDGLKDCDQECFTPPNSFVFELVAQDSGVNVFTDGTLNSDDITVSNTLTNSNYNFTFIDENDLNLIQITAIGWETEIVSLDMYVGSLEVLTLYVDAVRKNENCCEFTDYKEVRITDANYELDTSSGIYKIYLD